MTTPRHQRPSPMPEFLFGAPYYPEHWTAEERQHDAQRMVDAGVNVVRMAEFAWDVMEPKRDAFDFALFDDTIAHLGEHGIKTILCTPTATPPRWMTMGKDDWLRIDSHGVRMEHGNRQHVCTNNEDFRVESQRITRVMAEHYKDTPHIIGWQTDNEFYCHFSTCYCTSCQRGFQQWLADKYTTIDALNQRWGNRFWAQTYDSFDQIVLPRPGRYPAPGNPSHELDHARYLSDSLCEFQRQQVTILKATQSSWWVTHNGIFGNIDHWNIAEDLDFYGVDVYPAFAGAMPDNYTWGTLKNETCRYVSGSYIVPEQSGGAGGQLDFMLATCEPGQMRLWAYQSIAHGADGMLHFRWRSCRFGAEMYWNGIIDQDNVLRRRYDEFAQEGKELKRIGSTILGTVKHVSIGVLYSYENEELHKTLANEYPGSWAQASALIKQGTDRNLPMGLLHPKDEFDGMQIIIAPTHVAHDEHLAQKLETFVQQGGVVLFTGRSFTRDYDNQVIADTAPGCLRNLLGITREEEGCIRDHMDPFSIVGNQGETIAAHAGYEIIHCDTATALATWNIGNADRVPHAAQGHCALSSHTVGEGKALYFGSYLNADNAGLILDILLTEKPVAPLATSHHQVEMTLRKAGDRQLLFLLNHTLTPQTVSNLSGGTDLISNTPVKDSIELAPFGVAIILM